MQTNTHRESFSFQKRDISSKLIKKLTEGARIAVPLCPDYDQDRIGSNVSELMRTAMEAAGQIQKKYPACSFLFLIADTERDISRNFSQRNIDSSAEKLGLYAEEKGVLGKVSLFSREFPEWHTRQYAMEDRLEKALAADSDLDRFFLQHEEKRMDKYSKQYRRPFDQVDTRKLQIRHYSQYLTLMEYLLEQESDVLMNYQTENLRAITKYHDFAPRKTRLELIVY